MSEIEHVSDTALWVAHYRGEEGQRPDALFRDPLSTRLAGKRGAEIAGQMPYGGLMAWIMAIRTVAIDRMILDSLKDGVDTVVNLGAGLDTRPYRMSLPPTLRWIEIDFPHLIQQKTEALKDQKPVCRLERFALDFSRRTDAQKLYREIGESAKKILLITEGVVVYLSPDEVKQLSDDIHQVPQFHYWIQDYRNRLNGTWRTPRGYEKRLKSAPFKFMVEDTEAFFSALGWKVKDVIYSWDEGKRVKRPFPFTFPWGLLLRLMPRKKLATFKKAVGFFRFERKD
jgi:methyltransferase (TIGR00027 family)